MHFLLLYETTFDNTTFEFHFIEKVICLFQRGLEAVLVCQQDRY